jgi:hypothetical protein
MIRSRSKKDIVPVVSARDQIDLLSDKVDATLQEITALKGVVILNGTPTNINIDWRFDIKRNSDGKITEVTALNDILGSDPWKFGIERDTEGNIEGVIAQK